MSVPAAYAGLIIIWSTTPLAIKWSSAGPGFLFGVMGRMVLGVLLCLLILKILKIRLPMQPNARRVYLFGGLSLYSAMLTVYWSIQYIPSGLVSVIFGLSPILTSVLASWWLQESRLTIVKVIGIALGISGLALVFQSGLHVSQQSIYGIIGVLFAVCVHSVSSVWIKSVGQGMSAAIITTGELLVAVPLFIITWWVFDGSMPKEMPVRAGLAILYLGTIGSVIGFMLYFYILKKMQVATVTLIMLVTPVAALFLGHWIDHEPIHNIVWIGTGLILSGMLLHQTPGEIFTRKIPKKQA